MFFFELPRNENNGFQMKSFKAEIITKIHAIIEFFKSMKNIFVTFVMVFGLLSPLTAYADESCMSFKVDKEASWTTYPGKEMKYLLTWKVFDPNSCIISAAKDVFPGQSVRWVGLSHSQNGYWPGKWVTLRSGNDVIITLEFEISLSWLNAIGNTPGNYSNGMPTDWLSGWSYLSASGVFDIRSNNFFKKESKYIDGHITGAEIWSSWFTKQQGIYSNNCTPSTEKIPWGSVIPRSISYKVIETGKLAKVEISIKDKSDCIKFIYTPPISKIINPGPLDNQYLIQEPFWSSGGSKYFSQLVSAPTPEIRVLANPDVVNTTKVLNSVDDRTFEITSDGIELFSQENVSRNGDEILLQSSIDLSAYDATKISTTQNVGIVLGVYSQFNESSSGSPGGWEITWNSPTNWTARYRSAVASWGGIKTWYQTEFLKIPILDLLLPNGVKNAQEKMVADAAAAVAQAALDKAKADAEKSKKSTISCIKGSVVKKVTAVKPKCPKGFKVKI